MTLNICFHSIDLSEGHSPPTPCTLPHDPPPQSPHHYLVSQSSSAHFPRPWNLYDTHDLNKNCADGNCEEDVDFPGACSHVVLELFQMLKVFLIALPRRHG